MCTVSAIYDSIRDIPMEQWTPPAYQDLTEVLKRLAELDAKLNQRDCVDPEKAKTLERIEQHLAKIAAATERKQKRRAAKRRR
jgi:hypothetical protein